MYIYIYIYIKWGRERERERERERVKKTTFLTLYDFFDMHEKQVYMRITCNNLKMTYELVTNTKNEQSFRRLIYSLGSEKVSFMHAQAKLKRTLVSCWLSVTFNEIRFKEGFTVKITTTQTQRLQTFCRTSTIFQWDEQKNPYWFIFLSFILRNGLFSSFFQIHFLDERWGVVNDPIFLISFQILDITTSFYLLHSTQSE